MSAKNPNLVRQTVDLDREAVARFREHYPHVSLAGVLSVLFDMFMKEDISSFKFNIQAAANAAREDIKR